MRRLRSAIPTTAADVIRRSGPPSSRCGAGAVGEPPRARSVSSVCMSTPERIGWWLGPGYRATCSSEGGPVSPTVPAWGPSTKLEPAEKVWICSVSAMPPESSRRLVQYRAHGRHADEVGDDQDGNPGTNRQIRDRPATGSKSRQLVPGTGTGRPGLARHRPGAAAERSIGSRLYSYAAGRGLGRQDHRVGLNYRIHIIEMGPGTCPSTRLCFAPSNPKAPHPVRSNPLEIPGRRVRSRWTGKQNWAVGRPGAALRHAGCGRGLRRPIAG